MHYYNENDPFPAQWLRNFIDAGVLPAGHVDTRSIADVTAADLRGYVQCHFFAGIGGWPRALHLAGVSPDTRLWTGSCPCQPFSGAGKRKGTEDDRHLWPVWQRLIAQCRPPVVLGEQVASADGRNWFAAVRADLEALGYAAAGADLCAAGIGAPHIRQRIYFVGLADSALGRDCGQRNDREFSERIDFGEAVGMADSGSPDLRGESGGGTRAPGEDEAGGSRPERERGWDDDGGSRADGWLADATVEGEGRRGVQGSGESAQTGAVESHEGSAGHRADGGLADAEGLGKRADESGSDRGDRVLLARAEPGRDGGDNGADGWLADSDGDGRQPGQRNDPAARHGDHADAAGYHGRLADPDDAGPQGSDREYAGAEEREDAARHPRPLCASDEALDAGRPGSPDSFWGTADWLFCRDGRWRPVEPGTQPLAHGVPKDLGPLVSWVQELGMGPDWTAAAARAAARDAGRNRVGRLRGYGNAIVPQLAAVFIRAALSLP